MKKIENSTVTLFKKIKLTSLIVGSIVCSFVCSFNYSSFAQAPVITPDSLNIPTQPITVPKMTTPETLQEDLERLHKSGQTPAQNTTGTTNINNLPGTIIPNVPAINKPTNAPSAQNNNLQNTPAPNQTVKPSPVLANNITACQSSVDLSVLLSPACLDTFKVNKQINSGSNSILPAPNLESSNVAQNVEGMQCSIGMFSSNKQTERNMATLINLKFSQPNLARCIETGARLSLGIPGDINIVASEPSSAVIAVSCHRDEPDGKHILCSAQGPVQTVSNPQTNTNTQNFSNTNTSGTDKNTSLNPEQSPSNNFTPVVPTTSVLKHRNTTHKHSTAKGY